jgi:hypothetical protein
MHHRFHRRRRQDVLRHLNGLGGWHWRHRLESRRNREVHVRGSRLCRYGRFDRGVGIAGRDRAELVERIEGLDFRRLVQLRDRFPDRVILVVLGCFLDLLGGGRRRGLVAIRARVDQEQEPVQLLKVARIRLLGRWRRGADRGGRNRIGRPLEAESRRRGRLNRGTLLARVRFARFRDGRSGPFTRHPVVRVGFNRKPAICPLVVNAGAGGHFAARYAGGELLDGPVGLFLARGESDAVHGCPQDSVRGRHRAGPAPG